MSAVRREDEVTEAKRMELLVNIGLLKEKLHCYKKSHGQGNWVYENTRDRMLDKLVEIVEELLAEGFGRIDNAERDPYLRPL